MLFFVWGLFLDGNRYLDYFWEFFCVFEFCENKVGVMIFFCVLLIFRYCRKEGKESFRVEIVKF